MHQNPVHHGLVLRAENWPWGSAGWFERESDAVFRRMREGIKTDRVNVADAFEPFSPEEDAARAASSRRTPQEERTS